MELVSSPHETLEEIEKDAGARACFVIARSYELGACKPAPRDAGRACVEMATRVLYISTAKHARCLWPSSQLQAPGS